MMKHCRILLLFLLPLFSQAQWSDALKAPLSISSAPNFQSFVYSVADSLGNTYYLWTDFRDGRGDLYAQKLDALGYPQWAINGVKIGNIVGNQSYFYSPKIIRPDNNGGAFIAWQQAFDVNNLARRNLFGQYLSKDGKPQWASGGVKLSDLESNSADIYDTALEASIESNKIIVFYNVRQNADNQTLYHRQFSLSGVPIDNETKVNLSQIVETQVIYDAKSKLYVVLSLDANKVDYYVSRVSLSGGFFGTLAFKNPVGLTSRIDFFKLDKDGNAYIGRTLSTKQVYAYKIGVDGKQPWGANGVMLGTNQSFDLQIAPTSDGGALVSWIEPADAQHPYRTAKIDATGKISWQKDIFKAQSGNSYIFPNKFVTDGKDGAYAMWFSKKAIGYDMTLQRIDKDGNLVFGDNGKAITNWTFYSDWKLIPHPKGGVIAYYGSNADKTNDDASTINLYANRIKEDGTQGTVNSLILSDLTQKKYFAGDSVSIKFTVLGDGFSANNKFFVKLLDENGNFSDLTLQVVNSKVKLPDNIATGNYKFSLYALDPTTSSENQISFTVIKPTLLLNNLSKTEFLVGETFEVTITSDANFGADNAFSVLLSDANGSFTNAKEIGKNSTTKISAKIPTDLSDGNYKIKVMASKPALESSNSIDLKIKTPILGFENSFNKTLKTYPNPTNRLLIVEFKEDFGKELQLILLDMNGKIYETQRLATTGTTQQAIFDLGKFGFGTYFVKIIGNNVENSRKIIFQN